MSTTKREYDSRVNDRQIQTIEEKVDTSKALDASLVNTKSSGTESKEQDTSSRSRNDTHADDADIRPIYDEESMAEVQTTAESMSLLQDNSILSNLNSIMKERLYGGGGIPFQLKSDSLPTDVLMQKLTNTTILHQRFNSKKLNMLVKTKMQDGKDIKTKQGKYLEILKSKTKSKDNDKGSRSKITQHEETSLQHDKDQRLKNLTTKQSQQVQGSKIQDLTSGIRRPHIRGDC
ncbi:hypothetical protein Tco_1263957 [Tanacetum coccineum]